MEKTGTKTTSLFQSAAGFAVLFLIFALILAAGDAYAIDAPNYSTITPAKGVKTLGDYPLVDQDGKPFRFRELLSGGKPLLLSFVYTGCGHACPALVSRLKDALKAAGKKPGDRFTALTIGIDPENDTPEKLKSMGKRVGADFKAWRFASSDRKTIAALAADAGFYYRKTEDGFDHLNAIYFVSPSGLILKEIYGLDFTAKQVAGAISWYEAGKNAEPDIWKRDLTIFERIKLLCYTYDETTGTYRLDYSMLVGIALGVIVQMSIAGLALYLFRSARARGA